MQVDTPLPQGLSKLIRHLQHLPKEPPTVAAAVGVFGPSEFGTTDYYGQANSSTGNIAGFIQSPTNGSIYVPRDYVSGTALSGTATWNNTSFATFGLLAGSTYTWTFGSGENTDTVTVHVVPEPSSAALIGLGAAALLARRRRR